MPTSTDDRRIVENCPVCGRVKWTNGATCYHGQPPPPKPVDEPKPKSKKPPVLDKHGRY